MDRETDRFVRSLDFSSFHALEISGVKWEGFGFASYHSGRFPEYDVCERALKAGAFDIVIAEQVLEHVLWPYRAVRNVWQMLKPDGVFVITTPFLLRVHNCPVDCSRWTELGLKHLLAEGGFNLSDIMTGSWGNRSCVRGNFRRWKQWVSWKHSLRNEPDFPVVVWAFARKAS
jgi:SAM-dependent methyltransferase